jgi:hypothetical protein
MRVVFSILSAGKRFWRQTFCSGGVSFRPTEGQGYLTSLKSLS